jgi:hypothetical protein
LVQPSEDFSIENDGDFSSAFTLPPIFDRGKQRVIQAYAVARR